MLATKLDAEQGRRGVDVHAAPGRQVPRRLADDRRRRRLHVPAAVRPQERLQRAVDVRRRAQARRAWSRSTPATVAFHLEAPNGNFPYLVSSDNYNAIIVPKGTDFAKWDKTFIGTGPFKLQSYSQNVGANFVANPDYWGGAPNLDSTAFTFYASQQPQILALQGGQVDVIVQFVVQGAQSLLNNASVQDHQAQVGQPPRAVDAQRPGAVHRRAGPPGDRAVASTARAWCRRCCTATARSATTARSRRSSRRPNTSVPAAHPEHRQGQAAAGGRRPRQRLLDHADHRAVRGDPAAGPGDRRGGDRRSASTSSSRSRPRPTTTARRRSATPTGSTRR